MALETLGFGADLLVDRLDRVAVQLGDVVGVLEAHELFELTGAPMADDGVRPSCEVAVSKITVRAPLNQFSRVCRSVEFWHGTVRLTTSI